MGNVVGHEAGHTDRRRCGRSELPAKTINAAGSSPLTGGAHARRCADAQGRRTGRRHRHLPRRSCARSPTSRSSWCRTSPRRPSSPSRTRGCSTNCARDSLEQQTATAEVLERHQFSSPGELEPVFDAMLENATRICDAKFGNLFLFEGDELRCAAMHSAPPALCRRGSAQRPGDRAA